MQPRAATRIIDTGQVEAPPDPSRIHVQVSAFVGNAEVFGVAAGLSVVWVLSLERTWA